MLLNEYYFILNFSQRLVIITGSIMDISSNITYDSFSHNANETNVTKID